jgi:hypothetical protein
MKPCSQLRLLLIILVLTSISSLRCSGPEPVPRVGSQSHAQSHAHAHALQKPLEGRAGDVVALVFTSVDCPVANAMAPDLGRSLRELRQRGIRCYLVYPRSGITEGDMRNHAAAYGLDAVQVADPDKRLCRLLGADITPQGYVIDFDSKGEWHVRYRGRINDLYASIGNRRDLAAQHEWRDAALATISGTPVSSDQPPAVGCMIEMSP